MPTMTTTAINSTSVKPARLRCSHRRPSKRARSHIGLVVSLAVITLAFKAERMPSSRSSLFHAAEIKFAPNGYNGRPARNLRAATFLVTEVVPGDKTRSALCRAPGRVQTSDALGGRARDSDVLHTA